MKVCGKADSISDAEAEDIDGRLVSMQGVVDHPTPPRYSPGSRSQLRMIWDIKAPDVGGQRLQDALSSAEKPPKGMLLAAFAKSAYGKKARAAAALRLKD